MKGALPQMRFFKTTFDSADPVVRFTSLLSALPVTQNVFYGLIRKSSIAAARPMGAFISADRCLLADGTA